MGRHSGRGDGPRQGMNRPSYRFRSMGMTNRGEETVTDYIRPEKAKTTARQSVRRQASKVVEELNDQRDITIHSEFDVILKAVAEMRRLGMSQEIEQQLVILLDSCERLISKLSKAPPK